MPDTVIILDFGSQYTQLIARRVRELHVYCEILPYDAPRDAVLGQSPRGIILSGGPSSVYDAGAPGLPDWILESKVPLLGICYGMQLLAHYLGGEVVRSAHREYGPAGLDLLVIIANILQQPTFQPEDSAFAASSRMANYSPGTHTLQITKLYVEPPGPGHTKPLQMRVPAYELTYTVRYSNPGLTRTPMRNP